MWGAFSELQVNHGALEMVAPQNTLGSGALLVCVGLMIPSEKTLAELLHSPDL